MKTTNEILEKLLNKSRQIEKFIDAHALGHFIPAGHDREQYAANHFYISLDWYRAVILLTAKQLRGPALTLIRPMLESWIKGTWIKLVASNDQIQDLIMSSEALVNNKKKPKWKSTWVLLKAVNKKDKYLGEFMKNIWASVDENLNDCIHGNNQYLNLYLNKETRTIKGNVAEDFMARMLDRTNFVALVAAHQLREVHAEDQHISELFTKKQNEYLDYSKDLLQRLSP